MEKYHVEDMDRLVKALEDAYFLENVTAQEVIKLLFRQIMTSFVLMDQQEQLDVQSAVIGLLILEDTDHPIDKTDVDIIVTLENRL